MNKFVLPLVLFLCAGSAPLLTADQSRMRGAIDLLQEAKKSDHPVALLQEAKADLQKAARNKGGHRAETIGFVNQAIDYAKTGDKEKMIEKIDHAIAVDHMGISRGRR